MRNSSLEQRVEMIQNIREISANNERTMSNIHGIIGNSFSTDTVATKSKSKNKFKYRMLIASVMFGIYVLLAIENLQCMGYDSKAIDKMIAYNIDYKEILEQVNVQLTNAVKSE
ncbi:hypothetical protein C8E03_10174 [Lachnotalea glycerini]|uniref:Uncharacterized protein n=1 Tax=Lachnotalea glycerini TaxID=1763509 RepID=A0A255IIN3_9FIRM|nr:hypothetical protein [Lachnotalea glycerini]PXV95445.1 hypothetical protein C8E03_10174 [Lachnotalea glycerini]RDY32765.1 hypothetical protein CG710_002190 [Lachnotalea glycerini]